jgi:adenylate cyclase
LSRALLISALGQMGQIEEARQVLGALKEINPKYSFDEHIGRLPLTIPPTPKGSGERFAKVKLPS